MSIGLQFVSGFEKQLNFLYKYADKSLQLKTFGDFYEPGRKLYATDDNMKDLVRKPLEHSHKTV